MGLTRRGAFAVCLLAVTVLFASACSQSGPNEIPTLSLTAREFNFSGPDTLPAGLVRLQLINGGTRAHLLGILALSRGKTANDLLNDVRSSPNGSLPSYATELGGPDAVDPGMQSVAYANLKPGDYVFVCTMPDGDTGKNHLQHGMAKPFHVAGKPASPAPLPASATLDAFEFGYRLDRPIAAGDQMIHMTNSGRQPHEAQLARLPDGVTVDDYLALNDATSTTKGSSYGGSFTIQPGTTTDFSIYFTPGNYAFICFNPDPQTGKAHFELGQILQFSVP
jgi:hypothetical protein